MKKFGDLALGDLFYPRLQNGKMDLKWQLIKISEIQLTGSLPWPTVKVTQKVVDQKGLFNCVVVRSIDGKTEGYLDFIPDYALVFIEVFLR